MDRGKKGESVFFVRNGRERLALAGLVCNRSWFGEYMGLGIKKDFICFVVLMLTEEVRMSFSLSSCSDERVE